MIVLDRYEGDFAVIEDDGVIKKIPRDAILADIPEGSVIKAVKGKYEIDTEATALEREEISDLQDSLFD